MFELRTKPGELRVGETTDLVVELVNRSPSPCWMVTLELRLPAALSLVGGHELIEVERLDSGQAVAGRLRVRAREEGEWTLDVLELTYHDPEGRLHRCDDLAGRVRVLPQSASEPLARPSLEVGLARRTLPLGEWSSLDGRVRHLGGAAVERLALRVAGPVTVDRDPPWIAQGRMKPGEAARFHLPVRCTEPGARVPLRLSLIYRDVEGREGTVSSTEALRVEGSTTSVAEGEERLPVLMVSANPAQDLRTDEEQAAMIRIFETERWGDRFRLALCPAARPESLIERLHQVRPRIVHFSGHATRDAVVLLDELGGGSEVSSEVIEQLFRLLSRHVECVVFNACHSEETARRVSRHIPFVIGMKTEIHDQSAQAFTVGFYQALASGRPIDEAFEFGRVLIGAKGKTGMRTPVLFRNGEQTASDETQPRHGGEPPHNGGVAHEQVQAE